MKERVGFFFFPSLPFRNLAKLVSHLPSSPSSSLSQAAALMSSSNVRCPLFVFSSRASFSLLVGGKKKSGLGVDDDSGLHGG